LLPDPRKENDLAAIKIPQEQLQTLASLVDLPNEQMQTLLAALKDVPFAIDLEALEDAITPKLKSVSNSEKIIRALISLSVTRAHAEPPIPEFVNDVLQALERVDVTGEKRGRAGKLLTEILNIQAFGAVTKAIHLQLDHERIFGHVRILTDARPVYGTEVSQPPVAILITHTLKLSYFQDERSVDFYVTLDAQDLSELEAVLQRAKAKADSLSGLFDAKTIRIVRA
jgi:hypothetical protein